MNGTTTVLKDWDMVGVEKWTELGEGGGGGGVGRVWGGGVFGSVGKGV